MEPDANPARTAAKIAAEQVMTMAKTCPVPEIARLGRTHRRDHHEHDEVAGRIRVRQVNNRLAALEVALWP